MCASLYACKGFSFSSSFMAVSLSALLCNERLVYWTKMWKKGPFPLCKPPVCNFSFLWCVCVYFLSEKYTRTFWCETWIQKKRTLYQVFYTAPRLCTFLFLCILFKRSTSSKIFDLEGIVGAEERKKLLKKRGGRRKKFTSLLRNTSTIFLLRCNGGKFMRVTNTSGNLRQFWNRIEYL